jgi:predicted nucleotidyltransferase
VEPLREAADIFVEEPPSYKKILQEKLRQGLSYPAARECALSAQMPGAEALLREPNNILGMEYLKAVKRLDSSLVPITLKRSDAGYHSKKLSVSLSSSATAIREKYSQKQELKDCEYALPEEVFTLLQSHSNHFPVEPEDFSLLIYYRLASALRSKTLTRYGEISGELANRIEKNLGNYETLSKFTETLKTKNITHSRINRSLFQLLLGVENRLLEETKQPAPYLRLLGMRQSRSSFLRDVSHIPVITKVADYKKILGGSYSCDRLAFAMECFELDLFAADVYRQVLSQKTGVKMYDEYRSGIVLS